MGIGDINTLHILGLEGTLQAMHMAPNSNIK